VTGCKLRGVRGVDVERVPHLSDRPFGWLICNKAHAILRTSQAGGRGLGGGCLDTGADDPQHVGDLEISQDVDRAFFDQHIKTSVHPATLYFALSSLMSRNRAVTDAGPASCACADGFAVLFERAS
jgi:hypothetical protein